MWKFDRLTGWRVSSAPKHDEFFSSDNSSIAQSLVREMTQNSGDNAVKADGIVEVRFRFITVRLGSLPSQIFEDLMPHLDATVAGASDVLRQRELRVLVIEDFGTTGLTGAYDNPLDDGNFNSFWRRYGESQKGASKGGRHGVGKSTASSASQIRTIFGLTVRSDDGKALLYGQAALAPHLLPNATQRCDSYGLFAKEVDNEPLPYQGKETEAFAKAFLLERGARTGLSLVIPAPVSELTEEAILQAAIENCFYQVLSGQLRIVVGETTISKESIDGIAAQLPSLARMTEAIKFASECVRIGKPSIDVNAARTRFGEDELTGEQLAELRKRWLAGDTVSVCVHVPVPARLKYSRETADGQAWLYLRRASSAAFGRETYVRGRIIVPERRLMQTKDALGLMVVPDGPLSQFLGDSEQPSHTRWIQNKLTAYSAPADAFKRVRHALEDFERVVIGASEEEAVKDALKQYFFRPQERISEVRDERLPERQQLDIPPAAPAVLELRPARGGFVAARPLGTSAVKRVRLEVRYNVRRGKPKFHEADFNLDSNDIVVDIEGAQATVERQAHEGALLITDVQPGFRMKVTGFDPNRDLFVKAQAEEIEDGA